MSAFIVTTSVPVKLSTARRETRLVSLVPDAAIRIFYRDGATYSSTTVRSEVPPSAVVIDTRAE